MMKYSIPLLYIFTLGCLYGCVDNSHIDNDLESLLLTKITTPSNSIVIYKGVRTDNWLYSKSKLKLIIYSDSTSCGICSLNKISDWTKYMDMSDRLDNKLGLYYIYNPKRHEINVFREAVKLENIDYPILIDSLGEFERLNPHLPKNKAMHTFLLDENNNVVLVGNPLHNPKIEKMFKEIVEEKLGKEE